MKQLSALHFPHGPRAIFIILILIAVFFIIVLAGLVFFFDFDTPSKNEGIPAPALNEEPPQSLLPASWPKELEEQWRPDRSSYGVPLQTFAMLSPLPEDFGIALYLVASGKIEDLDVFTEAYYTQPEFYPSFVSNGMVYYSNHPPDRYGALGFGFYPSPTFARAEPGGTGIATVFLHSGFGVETWQGLHVQVEVSDELKPFFSFKSEQDAYLVCPSYPLFEPCWAQKVRIPFSVNPQTPSGTYTFSIKTRQPPQAMQEEWEKEFGERYAQNAFKVTNDGVLVVNVYSTPKAHV
ncbi:MAG: hypothetical protein HY393_04285 [Candidatus Diapherotrites archaeon]|nr:hypothetical protein [Candidatus Diapherotrites archaeon]